MTEMNITEIGFHVICDIEELEEILDLFSKAGVELWGSREQAVEFADLEAASSDFISIGIDEVGDLVVATVGYFDHDEGYAYPQIPCTDIDDFRAYVNGLEG